MAVAVVELATGVTPAASAAGDKSRADKPVLTARTTIAGAAAPTLAQGGTWMRDHGDWATSFRSQSVAAGTTRVHVFYRSPTITVHKGQRFFDHFTDVEIDHQSAPTSSAVELDATRLCVVHRGCDPWFGFGTQPPSHFEFADLPFTVSSGNGWGPFTWEDGPARIYVEWSWTWQQKGADVADLSIRTSTREHA